MLKKHWNKLNGYLSNDIGIDLGTANTLVYMRGQGIVINEPSVVAVNQKTGQVVAVGAQAKEMLGRTPAHIVAVKPLVGGVISDFEVTEEMLAYLIRRAEANFRKVLGPRVVVGVPSGITNVETRAVRDATKNNGARQVFIVEEPMAAAIGIRLAVNDPIGNMIVDIGGGTSDIAVISLGGIVRSKSLKTAGDKLNDDIVSFIRSEHKILIGEQTAENLKIAIGSVLPPPAPLEAVVRGRDLITGLPREIVVTDTHVREAIALSIDNLIEAVREVLETTPPEIVSDVMGRGLYLVGGGALIRGLAELLAENLKLPVHQADDPMTAVARGAGIILEDFDRYKDVLIENEDGLPLHS
ncbi:MAG: rod shape-determining protein [Patescibacteria group bacterium]